MRTSLLTFFVCLLSFASLFAQGPDIKGMWSTSNPKKPKVYTITEKELVCNISDINNRYASSVKNFRNVTFIQTDQKNGRIIAQHDSENVTKYYAFDYFNLNTDSVKFVETKTGFESAEAAKACPVAKADKAEIFYTTEHMSRLSRIRKTPALTKEGYIAFLKDAMKELQKPENKNIKPEPGLTPDVQAKNFMTGMLSKKQYQGKIIPETLEIAMQQYKEDASVKKLYPYVRASFMAKPVAKPAGK